MDNTQFNEVFFYNPEEGVLKWKKRDIGYFKSTRDMNAWNARYADKLAGNKKFRGTDPDRIVVMFGGKLLPVHRIIWVMIHNEIPKNMVIDHIDGNPFNNKLSNIRLATNSGNSQNSRKKVTAKQQLKGVSLEANRKKPWKAAMKINGKTKTLGRFSTEEEAHAAYCESAKKEFKEFARLN